jgi:hypothetical protein
MNFCLFVLEHTEQPNSPDTLGMPNSGPKAWQESVHAYYSYVNRHYTRIIYYTWRFAEIHVYKLVLFLMILTSVLKVKGFAFHPHHLNLLFRSVHLM